MAFARAYELVPELTEARNNWQTCGTAIKNGMALKFEMETKKDQFKMNMDFSFNAKANLKDIASVDRGGIVRAQSEIVKQADGQLQFVPSTSKSGKQHLSLALPLFGAPEPSSSQHGSAR